MRRCTTICSLRHQNQHRHTRCVKVAKIYWVCLFYGISAFLGFLNVKATFLEEQWYYLTHSRENKGIHTFPKGICPKVNVIARLELILFTTIPQSSTLSIVARGNPLYGVLFIIIYSLKMFVTSVVEFWFCFSFFVCFLSGLVSFYFFF